MKQGELVHPRMTAGLVQNFFPSSCTILQSAQTQSSTGAPIGFWAPLTGHTSIPCRLAPESSREQVAPAQSYSADTFKLELDAAYPDVTTLHRASVDGVVYEVTGAQLDGNQVLTRLLLRRIAEREF